jgi:hypothetical protein
VTDQLSLAIWLARASQASRVKHFEKLLRIFPFSQRPQPQSTIAIHGIDTTEPPLLERAVNGPVEISEIIEVLSDYAGDDIAYRVESWWDLWQYDEDWSLRPARVVLSSFGPDFESGSEWDRSRQEDLRIDFGVDSHYLPQADIAGSARLIESNIKSLLRIVHEVDTALPVEKRRLETESGENFADRLQRAVAGNPIQ